MKRTSAIVAASILLAVPIVSRAGSISVSASTTGTGGSSYAATDFDQALSVSRFDPTLGTLTSIDVAMTGRIEGTARFENLDAAPARITADLSARITLSGPNAASLVTVLPTLTFVSDVAANDGSIDFGGAAGRTFAGVRQSQADSLRGDSAAADLALFTGTGSIGLEVRTVGASSATGAGNLATSFQTLAEADLTVTYHFDAAPLPTTLTAADLTSTTATPEPSTMILAGVGLAVGLATWICQGRRRLRHGDC